MKNLPNKIYLNFGDITKEEFKESDYKEFCKIDEYAVTYCEDKAYDTDVEYTRTDAFIEKACEWLEPVFKNYAGYYVGKDILEDFKKIYGC
jgi:hypothetical protein